MGEGIRGRSEDVSYVLFVFLSRVINCNADKTGYANRKMRLCFTS